MVTDLKESQEKLFARFRSVCSEDGLLERPADLNGKDALYGINDDATLLRFLQADNFDVDVAYVRFKKTMEMRIELQTSMLYDTIDIESFEKARILYPHWSGRTDKRGLPICFFDVSKLDSTTISEYKIGRGCEASQPSPALLQAVVYHDCFVRFILPLSSMAANARGIRLPISSCLYVVNVAGFTIKQAWALKDYAADISKLLASNYPEMIDRVLVVGAPRYFSAVWAVIKNCIDPVTASKIHILPLSDALQSLTQYIDIDNVPIQFGGKFVYNHGMTPNLDETMRNLLCDAAQAKLLTLHGPFKWMNISGQEHVPIPVGKVEGLPRYDNLS